MLIKTECELYEAIARKQPIYFRYITVTKIVVCENPFVSGDTTKWLGGDWSDHSDPAHISSCLRNGQLATTREALEPPPPEIRVGMHVGSRNADGSNGYVSYIILAFDDKTILAAIYDSNPTNPVRARTFARKDGQTNDPGLVSLNLNKEITL